MQMQSLCMPEEPEANHKLSYMEEVMWQAGEEVIQITS